MVKKEKTETEKQEMAHAQQLHLAKLKNDYIRNLINGRYFLARSNMLAEQIQSGKILENIDGCPKTEEFMRSEYAHQKMQAIHSMRDSHFAKLDLIKDFSFTEDNLYDLEEDYYNGKIIREDYNEGYRKGNKAAFVESKKE